MLSWLVVIAFYVVNIVLIAQSVMKSGALLDDRVYGGIAVYLMVVVVFATPPFWLAMQITRQRRCCWFVTNLGPHGSWCCGMSVCGFTRCS